MLFVSLMPLRTEQSGYREWNQTPMPMSRSKLIKPAAATRCTVVDPRTLGRPFHRLHAFARQLQERYASYFERRFNRRYGIELAVTDAAILRSGELPAGEHWRQYRSPTGLISVALDRVLLLALLDYRYGGKEAAQQSAAVDDTLPETETEQRFNAMLGLDLLDVLVEGIRSAQQAPAPGGFRPDLASRPACALGIRIGLEDRLRGIGGALLLALDDAWLTQLLSGIAQKVGRSAPAVHTQPLANKMQIALTARLLSMEMTLGDVLDIRPGDVIPVSIGDAEVLVGDSRLFTAAVAEHNGKLWLTSFADQE